MSTKFYRSLSILPGRVIVSRLRRFVISGREHAEGHESRAQYLGFALPARTGRCCERVLVSDVEVTDCSVSLLLRARERWPAELWFL